MHACHTPNLSSPFHLFHLTFGLSFICIHSYLIHVHHAFILALVKNHHGFNDLWIFIPKSLGLLESQTLGVMVWHNMDQRYETLNSYCFKPWDCMMVFHSCLNPSLLGSCIWWIFWSFKPWFFMGHLFEVVLPIFSSLDHVPCNPSSLIHCCLSNYHLSLCFVQWLRFEFETLVEDAHHW